MPADSFSDREVGMRNAELSAVAGSAIPRSTFPVPRSSASGGRGMAGSGKIAQLIDEAGPESSLDAERILSEHPSLRRSKSAVLGLAYEEYCRRVDAGEEVDAHGFVRRFPGYQTSLLRQIEAHEWLAGNTDLLQPPVVWPMQGEEFLGFHLLEELGRGAFSRVFLAEELALGQRTVVVKVSRLNGMEPQALGRLRHPHIVPVHSVQFDVRSGLSAICMPFYGRATLYDLLDHAFREGTMPPHGRVVEEAIRRVSALEDPSEEAPRKAARHWWDTSYVNAAVRLAIQLSEALEFAHRSGIFHCDIKPSNVLLCRTGAKLFDFNLALDEDAVTGRGGTLPYMAPEQLRMLAGKSPGKDLAVRIDGRTDLFSLGVLLYELLSGQLPWGTLPTHLSGERVAEELVGRHARGPKPLRCVAPTLNPRLARVIESCLAHQPADRPATAGEFTRALRREMGWGPRSGRFSREHRRAMLAGLGSTILMAGVGGGFWLTAEPRLDRHMRLGKESLQSEDYPRAIAHFQRVLDTQGENHEARFLKARAHMLDGDYPASQGELRLLGKALPKNPYVPLCLGHCVAATASEITDFSKASGLFQRVKQHFARNAAFCNNLGYCQASVGSWNAAIRALNDSVELNRTSPVSHHNLGLAYLGAALESRSITPAERRERDQLLQNAETQIRCALECDDAIARYHLDFVLIGAANLNYREFADERRRSLITEVVTHSQTAMRLGSSPQELENATDRYPQLRSAAGFPDLSQPPSVDTRHVPPDRLLDPLLEIDVLSLSLSPSP